MSSEVIGLDFDGVVTNPHKIKSQELKRLGYNVEPQFTARSYCIKELQIPLDIYEEAAYTANMQRLMEIPLEDFALQAINYWMVKGFKLYIITSRKNEEISNIPKYLEKFNLEVEGIINTNRKSKLSTIKAVRPTIYIDDSPEELLDLMALKKHCTFILLKNIANQYWQKKMPPFWFYGDWKEIVQYVDQIF